MKKINIFIVIFCFIQTFTFGQNIIYKQTNKIIEYNYGIIDTADLKIVTETEKIKHELKIVEKTYSKTIKSDYETEFKVNIDNNEYQKNWMKLAKQFKYTSNNIELYDGIGNLMKTITYSPEQMEERIKEKLSIQSYGYHPGLTAFPEFTENAIAQLATQNIIVKNVAAGITKMILPTKSITFNKNNYTILTEYTDNDGVKTKETKGYEPYLNNKGFLLKIDKTERFLYSIKGPCITDVKLIYYNEYDIQDNGKLISKSLEKTESINIYPNPNEGVFTAAVQLNEANSITSVKVINVLNGNTINIDNNNQNTFLVNLPNIPPGQYVLQVITNNQISLTANFFKH
jgi:hypothetical protein